MKISQIIQETTTASGAVAPVEHGFVKMQSRNPSVYGGNKVGNLLKGKKTNKSFANSVNESAEISEADLSEQDLIVVPGQGRSVKTGFVSHDKDRTDHEVEMAISDLFQSGKNAEKIYNMISSISEDEGLEGWVQEKIIKAADYLNTVREYLEGKQLKGISEVSDTLRNRYVSRASDDYSNANFAARASKSHPGLENYSKEQEQRAKKRAAGLNRALSDKRLGREVDEGVEDRTSYQVAKVLFDYGIKYDPAREDELIKVIGLALVKELDMSPKMARSVMNDEDFLSDTMGELRHMEQSVPKSVNEASLSQMRDYFNQQDNSTNVSRDTATPGKNPAGIPYHIQTLVNRIYHSGKITPAEREVLKQFQERTNIKVGIKGLDESKNKLNKKA